MVARRTVLKGLIAAGLCGERGWAAAGSPSHLAAAGRPDGSFSLCGLAADGQLLFEIPLPARGHAAAAHPTRPDAVAFARRPGTYAIVIDCVTGVERARIKATEGRHFCGHGAFSAEGDLLFTTENDYEAARGVIGIWDVRAGYRRVGEMGSGGIGPHDVKLMASGRHLVVANGGIETHPETGRTKLNLPSMRPNLSILGMDGSVHDIWEPEPAFRKNSIRHLAVSPKGDVAFAMQWQGDASVHPPLLGLWEPDGGTDLLAMDDENQREMQGYAGSVAFSRDGETVAITSPRGGLCHVFTLAGRRVVAQIRLADVCGIATHHDGFLLSSGTGVLFSGNEMAFRERAIHPRAWDNHLVAMHRPMSS